MVFSVLVELRDYPCRGIRNTKIEDFSTFDKVIERMSQLLNRGSIIPIITTSISKRGYTTNEHTTNQYNPSAISSNCLPMKHVDFSKNYQRNSRVWDTPPNSS